MNICPITYKSCDDEKYSRSGLKKLSAKIKRLKAFPFSAEEQRREAIARAPKMSIQGLQLKLSVVFSAKSESFKVVDRGGKYILKPQSQSYPELPENEDLTMRLATIAGIPVPLHGMIYSADDSMTYFVKRFDRSGRSGKVHCEDFAQLSGKTRETKYDYSMERLIEIIGQYCSFPAVERAKLFRLILFNFLVGNEDMHLKNYSVLHERDKTELSPAYDLLNTTIAMPAATEEIALTLNGKKKGLTRNMLFNYFGKERLALQDRIISGIERVFSHSFDEWSELIDRSFLSDIMKKKYRDLIQERRQRLSL